jgi:hypothetical protein
MIFLWIKDYLQFGGLFKAIVNRDKGIEEDRMKVTIKQTGMNIKKKNTFT